MWILRNIAALQLALLSFSVVRAGVIPSSRELASRGQAESQEDFDHTTASFKQQGLCRAYLSLGHVLESVSTCAVKCGDMVKKEEEAGNMTSVGCAGLQGLPTETDPKGDNYMVGRCICDAPLVEIIFNELLIALPAIAEIGCAILFDAFDLILEVGLAAIPGVGEMTVGMKAAIQGAKTLAENGQDALSFAQWFKSPCGHSKYTDQIDKLFDPLSSVPDSVLPGLGCKGKKCPGKKDPKNQNDDESDTRDTKKDDKPSTKKDSSSTTTSPSSTTQSLSSATMSSTTTTDSTISSATTIASSISSKTSMSPTTTTVSTSSATATTVSKVFKLTYTGPLHAPANQDIIPSTQDCTNKRAELSTYTKVAVLAALQQGARYKLGKQSASKFHAPLLTVPIHLSIILKP